MSDLLVEAYSKDPSIAQNTIDHLIKSTNQQGTVSKAITKITKNLLNQCETTRDVAAISDYFDWFYSLSPKRIDEVLPQLQAISEDVRAALNASTAYRQSELLNPALTKLKNLNNTLAYQRNPRLATTFGSIVQRWTNILKTAKRTLAEEARASGEIAPVYLAGQALEPDRAAHRFKGRADLFAEIERLSLINPPPVLLLYGGRRTGKTSTLKYLRDRLPSAIVPLFIDLQGLADATKLETLALSLAEAIQKAALNSRKLTLPYPDKKEIEKDPFPGLRHWFDQIERNVRDKRFLLCLDEFERLEEIVETTGSRAHLNFFRHITQHRSRWIVLYSGSHFLDELQPYWTDYLINSQSLRVSYLDEASARELIREPVPDFPDIYEPAAVDAIIQVTRCQPYQVQLLCSTLVDRLNREKRTQATPEDVEICLNIALETGYMTFREFWLNLSEAEQNLLSRLLAGESPTPRDNLTIRQLIRKETLEKSGETYQFQVPLVERFIRQQIGLE